MDGIDKKSFGYFNKCKDLKIIDPLDLEMYKKKKSNFFIQNGLIYLFSFSVLQILNDSNIFKRKVQFIHLMVPSVIINSIYNLFFQFNYFVYLNDLDEKYSKVFDKYINRNKDN